MDTGAAAAAQPAAASSVTPASAALAAAALGSAQSISAINAGSSSGIASDTASKKRRCKALLPDSMRSCRFVLTYSTLLFICAAFCIILITFGIALFVVSEQLKEVGFDYTQCATTADSNFAAPSSTLTGVKSIDSWKYNPTLRRCTIRFVVPASLSKRVFMYVRITNMYQNHRLYLKSLDAGQLAGKVYASASDFPTDLETNCAFLLYANCDTAAKYTWTGNSLTYAASNPDCLANPRDRVITNASTDAQYYPCGLVANSMFSDDISELACVGNNCRIGTYVFSDTNIAWPEDASQYAITGWMGNPALQSQINTKLIPPPQWRAAWPSNWSNGYNSTNTPNLAKWERFQVWMRKAGLPTFRKLWGRNDSESLDAGTWEISITDSWDCRRFGGAKALVFSEIGFMGSKNNFLGIAFITVGIVCAVFFLIVAFYRPRGLGDHTYFSWNKVKVE